MCPCHSTPTSGHCEDVARFNFELGNRRGKASRHGSRCACGKLTGKQRQVCLTVRSDSVAKLTYMVDMRSWKLALGLAEFSSVPDVELHLPGLQTPRLTVVADGSGVAPPSVFDMATQSWGADPRTGRAKCLPNVLTRKRRTHLPAPRG